MSLIAGRYLPLENPRPGTPQRARDVQTALTVLLRDTALPRGGGDVALAHAQAAKGIFHPSLITLFDVVPLPDDRVLLAYESVASQTVAQVSGGQPFNPKRAVEIVTEIADAVAELHAHGVAHGGISQTTVLITMKGKAKLDRAGDPSLDVLLQPDMNRDLVALADLLGQLSGQKTGGGMPGREGIQVIVERARSGRFASAASFAATLRRVVG